MSQDGLNGELVTIESCIFIQVWPKHQNVITVIIFVDAKLYKTD